MPSEQYKQFDCYQVLGVSPTAKPQEIRSAYKQASLRSHPDRGGTHDAQVKINLAYEVLSDPIQRQAHDTHWRISVTGGSARPQASRTYSTGQTYTRPKETPTEPRQTQREARHREPLGGLKDRIYQRVESEKARIWQDLNNRAQRNERDFRQQLSNKRYETVFAFVGAVVLGVIATAIQYPWLWIGVAYFGLLLISRLGGVQIAKRSFSIFNSTTEALKQHAQQVAKESCAKEAGNLEHHFSSLASLSELLLRPSTFDDSEEQVARRLTASFFLMGYAPIQFDRENRTLLFTDGEEKILVRFRHRAGTATNITYVQKLAALMLEHGTVRGFLFCSPGLSGNAANYANANRVKWYTLETMNQWIEQVLVSDYSGPTGDVLMNLDKLRTFLATLSPVIAARSYKPRFRYGRHRF